MAIRAPDGANKLAASLQSFRQVYDSGNLNAGAHCTGLVLATCLMLMHNVHSPKSTLSESNVSVPFLRNFGQDNTFWSTLDPFHFFGQFFHYDISWSISVLIQ